MTKEIEKINYITEENLPKIKILIIGLIIIIGLFSGLDSFLDNFFATNPRLIFYGILILFWILFWLYKRFHLPRNEKGKI
ncbi:hypothetical protein KKI23_04350, partial [Patescibacteria group bacterium]|nr:hypothetical protein [Patescibacteria group bacterium]